MTELIATPEKTELADGWRKVVNVSDEYDDRHQEAIDMLAEFEPMQDGHLGTIKTVQHRIDL